MDAHDGSGDNISSMGHVVMNKWINGWDCLAARQSVTDGQTHNRFSAGLSSEIRSGDVASPRHTAHATPGHGTGVQKILHRMYFLIMLEEMLSLSFGKVSV